jgi:hypothetical protein
MLELGIWSLMTVHPVKVSPSKAALSKNERFAWKIAAAALLETHNAINFLT